MYDSIYLVELGKGRAHFQLLYFTSIEDEGQDSLDVILLGILQARKMTWKALGIFFRFDQSTKNKKLCSTPLLFFYELERWEECSDHFTDLTSLKYEKNARKSIPKYLVEPRNSRAHFQILYLTSIEEMGPNLLDMNLFIDSVSHLWKKPKRIHEINLLAPKDLEHYFFILNLLSLKKG